MAKEKIHYVFSTLATDVKYSTYRDVGGVPDEVASVVIKGGTGVITKRLITPLGVATKVSDEDIALLRSNPTFQIHEKNGYVRIEERYEDPEKVASDMNTDDPGRQSVDADYRKGGRFAAQETGAPTTGAVGEE